MTTHHHKILFVAPNWLGDAVMSLPLLGMVTSSKGASKRVEKAGDATPPKDHSGPLTLLEAKSV